MRPGYVRDCDCWLYATTDGRVYLVEAPGEPEPAWREVGPPLSGDAEPRTPGPEELATFERERLACGIAG